MRARLASAAALATLLLVGCAGAERAFLGGPGEPRFREEFARADSSAVIAAELAFARAAQEKGQWTAFAEYAADDAVMFVPEPVNAKDWLRRQTNPTEAVKWQPHQVWSSCDGTLAVSKGAWQRADGSVGYFTTVWERQRGGDYKWVMDQGDVLAQPLEAPEFVEAKVADCTQAVPVVMSGEGMVYRRHGLSRDSTLYWQVDGFPDGHREVDVLLWDAAAGNHKRVVELSVAPEQ